MKTTNQRAAIRHWLKAGRSITPREALDLYGCFRLSAVIHYLRHVEHLNIKTVLIDNENGNPYAKYWLEPEPANA